MIDPIPPTPVTNPPTHKPNGRFAKGNKAASGSRSNPHAGRASRLRSALLKELQPSDMREIAKAMIAKAKGGDLAAAKELLDRSIGKPGAHELIERIEELESLLNGRERGIS